MQTHTQHTRKHAHIQSYITHAFTYKIHGFVSVRISLRIIVMYCVLSIHVLRLSRPTYSRVRKHLGDGFLVNLAHPHETECLPVVVEFEGLSAVEFCRAFVRAYVALNGIVGIRIHC